MLDHKDTNNKQSNLQQPHTIKLCLQTKYQPVCGQNEDFSYPYKKALCHRSFHRDSTGLQLSQLYLPKQLKIIYCFKQIDLY